MAMIGDQFLNFQKPIVASMQRQLKKQGYGLLYVCGGALKPTADWEDHSEVTRNAIYSLSRNFPVEGFVLLTSAIGNHADDAQLAHFARQFTHRPVVCFGSSVPDLHCVRVDNYSLMKQLMIHMTAVPSRQRFVFIRGYVNSPSSQAQEKAFREALNTRRIPIDESLFIDGNYRSVDAYYAMDELLNQTLDIDAVVAANDEMAQSAVHALMKHGLRIPEDVIVSGFDNSAEADSSLPPLTSVQCSMDALSSLVIEKLQEQMQSGIFVSTDNTTVSAPAKLVIRASTEPAFLPARHDVNQSSAFDAAEFSESMLLNLQSLKTPEGIDPKVVIDDVVSMLVDGDEYCTTRLHADLLKLHERREEVYWWRHLHHQITANLQRQGSAGQSGNALARIVSILGQIHETIWTVENSMHVESTRRLESLGRLRSTLNAVNSVSDLLSVIRSLYSQNNVNAWFICLYEHASGHPDERARLFYQYPADCLHHDMEKLFPSADVLPGGYLQSEYAGTLLLEPLCIGTTHLGYVVIDLKKEQFSARANVTEVVDYIGAALWRVLWS